MVGVADRRADTERLLEARVDLRRLLTLAPRLTPDQRLVLFARVALDMNATEFCERHAWFRRSTGRLISEVVRSSG